jgi:thiol:disulfide interchange protein
MSKQIISEIANREAFFHLLQHNPGLIIIKLGAKWCGGCKLVEKPVHGFFASSPPEVICADIDVDVSFDFYSFLKSKKMVNGIPVLLCYKKGNSTYIPDEIVTGADPNALHVFFTRCGKHLMDALSHNPVKQVRN